MKPFCKLKDPDELPYNNDLEQSVLLSTGVVKNYLQSTKKTNLSAEASFKNELRSTMDPTIENIKREYSSVIKVLELKLMDCKEQLALERNTGSDAEAKVKLLTLRLEDQERHLESVLKEQSELARKLSEYQEKCSALSDELSSMRESRNEIEDALGKCQNKLKANVALEEEAREASAKALHLAEQAMAEKAEIAVREQLATSEKEEMRKAVSVIIEEAGEKVQKEVNEVKREYNERTQQLILDMRKLQLDLEEKEHALARVSRQEELMRNELETTRGNSQFSFTNKILDLEKKLEDTFQKLVLSERLCLQLSHDKDNMRQDVKRMLDGFEMDVVSRDRETRRLQGELQIFRDRLKVAQERERQLKITMEDLDKRDRENEERLTKTNNELQTQLADQYYFTNKWKEGIKDIVEKLQHRLKELRAENHLLKKKNKQLTKELDYCHNKINTSDKHNISYTG